MYMYPKYEISAVYQGAAFMCNTSYNMVSVHRWFKIGQIDQIDIISGEADPIYEGEQWMIIIKITLKPNKLNDKEVRKEGENVINNSDFDLRFHIL